MSGGWELINLDGSIDPSDEEVGCVEAYCSSEEPEGEHHQQGVPKIQQGWNEFCDFKLCNKVEYGVSEYIDCWSSWYDEWSPPPVVVLSTQLEVDHYNWDLWAGDDEDDKHQEEETKQIVVLVLPDCSEDEEELNKHSSKG